MTEINFSSAISVGQLAYGVYVKHQARKNEI